MEITKKHTSSDAVSYGNVYVMTHSFFSDVVRIGCTPTDPIEYAITLSAKTLGDYTVVFSLQCKNPCKVKKQIRQYLNAKAYVNDFYQIPTDVAAGILKRVVLRIPVSSAD
ncbi:GIY-YIG nuclease family protein [Colwellia sp. MB02u-10]|uniref:GIY-YIG nuclease family protein n=1 Tax=Colwellia sp. MB02u-10 TaxID=2759828 RepID=UPI0015F66192|nr:GIY-YIG nuclease family protein [Colwellia sp. MB02u-10]MBA6339546.1 GIY-YIG nuclease family protein [Colwellia sp. MB02u-10]